MRNPLSILLLIALALGSAAGHAEKKAKVAPSYAWTISQPLGNHYESTIDTLTYNYAQKFVPWLISDAYATTGNYGNPGQTQIFFQRPQASDFVFEDNMPFVPDISKHRYYNSRRPMTILAYSWGGNKYSGQDRLSGEFSGNVNRKLQFGAGMDYVYSKGSYENQANKEFSWKAASSYIGDRYELQAYFTNYNLTNKENGGIKDDLYITDPAKVQGGTTSVDPKSIPIYFSAAHSKISGLQFYMNHRYKVGFYEEKRDSTDSIVSRRYIPVTSFIWTFKLKNNSHMYLNTNAQQDTAYFKTNYLSVNGSDETAKALTITNTVGVELLEGFRSWAKFGLAAYATHEVRKFTQPIDTILDSPLKPADLTPLPEGLRPNHKETQHLLWVGGQLIKQRGSLLRYTIGARIGLLGEAVGDVEVDGNISTRFRLFGDSVTITGLGYFKNKSVPYFLKHYISTHFAWNNDFGKERRFRVGGVLDIPHTRTNISAGYETLQNYVYWGNDGKPAQFGDALHVLSASIDQKIKIKILNLDFRATYQTSTHESVLSLPKFAVYGNLYLRFRLVRVLDVQIGVDCNYYTSYYAPAYTPATMSFYTQDQIKCGNFAMMNAYANFKLYKARFFVCMTHVNQGLFGGKNYFASPHYPLNPRRFELGVSVDFTN